MSQGLVGAPHDAESDVVVTVFHEGGDDGVKGALAWGEGVGLGRVEHEKGAAILQDEAHAANGDAGAEAGEIALDQRDDIALPIDSGEISCIAGGRRAALGIAVGFLGIDELSALLRVIL